MCVCNCKRAGLSHLAEARRRRSLTDGAGAEREPVAGGVHGDSLARLAKTTAFERRPSSQDVLTSAGKLCGYPCVGVAAWLCLLSFSCGRIQIFLSDSGGCLPVSR